MKWLHDNTEEFFYIDTSEILKKFDMQFSEITEAKYSVKEKYSDANTLVTKIIGDGITKDPTRNYLAIKFESADYNVLEEGKQYTVGIAIKTDTMTNFLEVKLEDTKLVIARNFFN